MHRIEIEHRLGIGMVTYADIVAGEAEDIMYPQNVSAEQFRFQSHTVAVPTGELENSLCPPFLCQVAHRERGYPHHRALVVGGVYSVNPILQKVNMMEHFLDIGALRRTYLTGDHEISGI